MRLDPVNPSAVWSVALNMRRRDRAEFEAVFGSVSATELANRLAFRYGDRQDCFVVVDEQAGDVAVGGFLELRPRTATLLLFATEEFRRVGLPFTRRVRAMMANMEAAGIHRFECMTLAGYIAMHRWLNTLGLRPEGRHPGWGAQGEEFLSYARVTA